mmetsp:Transcript_24690/g.49102  ORF Transcript_24690/g.49102 Transcript_24690/m.49102 type:complete len:233 (-) Transcript_24690:1042-1740(-)
MSSASFTIRSISSSLSRPFSLVMVIFCSAPVPLSTAPTDRIPLASTSNATSICGTPLGAGGIPLSSNEPRSLLDFVIARSPSYTCIETPGWLSAKVENVCDFLAGIVVPLSTSFVMTPPAVSIPRDRGATSRSSTSLVASEASPERIPAWTAAPYATASSGLMPLLSSLPPKYSERRLWTLGMRVEPPTRTTWSTSDFFMPASFSTWLTGARVFLKRSRQSSSNFALDTLPL